MKLGITILLACFFYGLTHAQQFVQDQKVWSYYVEGNPPIGAMDPFLWNYTTVYSFGPEEELEGQTYRRLRTGRVEFSDYNASNEWETTSILMREDSLGRVYLRDTTGEDILIYDFSLAIGDTFYNTLDNCTFTVLEIDSVVLFNGTSRKRWVFDDEYPQRYWVEGIGSSISFIPECDFTVDAFLCYKEFDALEYHFDGLYQEADCFLIPVDTEEPTPEELHIYPNPVSDILYIEAEHLELNGRLQVYTLSGQLKLEQNITDTSVETLNLKGIAPGVYLLHYHNQYYKIVKNN